MKTNVLVARDDSCSKAHPAGTGLAIETHELAKRYGERTVAVRRLSMNVRRGEIYGFLGPNGAGKTTTLRMLTGLVRPSSGSARILGEPPGSPPALAHIGALIEAPGFYPYLSGRDNLRVLAQYGRVPLSRIDDALDRVQLGGRASDRFDTYSLGMKQRLGVAAALLKDPELLILDEPTNGLDPAGMADMRALIHGLGRDGRTVLVSSHLMTEVEQVCDRVGVIRAGSLVAEGNIDDLRGAGHLLIRARPLQEARRLVAELCGAGAVSIMQESLRVIAGPDRMPAIDRALVWGGIDVYELRQERDSLEEVFLELTQEGGIGHEG